MENTYVVTRPNVTFYPFGGCYKVSRITDKSIFCIKTLGEDSWEAKISKKDVLFFTETNIAESISEWNRDAWYEHQQFETNVKNLQREVERTYSNSYKENENK